MSSAISQTITLNRVALSVQESINADQRQQWTWQVKQALEKVSIQTAMPPQAILIVRHLEDPDPGQLLAQRQGERVWEQAAQQVLNDCWRNAVRPALSPVPTTANSVWFVDPAEWLTCLSRDIHQGVAQHRWWWQTSLRSHTHRSATETLYQLWQEAAQWLPATLRFLLKQQCFEAAALLAKFQPAQSEQLLESVLHVYQCSLPVNLYSGRTQEQSLLVTMLAPHLDISVQQIMPLLEPETQALVAVCLTLPNTTQLLQASISSGESAPNVSVTESATSAQNPNTSGSVPRIVSLKSTPLDDSEFQAAQITNQDNDASEFAIDSILPANSSSNSELVPLVESADLSSSFSPDLNLAEAAEQGIATALGGLWYLVNVLIALDWPGMLSLMSPWHQLLALAQALLPELPLDPVWEHLETMAGEPVPAEIWQQWQEHTRFLVYDYLSSRLEQPIVDYLLEPATLYMTRTHVDVVFTLDQIRLDVRMAGLDQDPGWIPELARVIAFHYE